MGDKHFSAESGFTLVELIIAAGVIGIAMAMMMGSIMSIATAQRSSEADAAATAFAASIMEEVQATSLNGLMSYLPPATSNLGATTDVTVVCLDSSGTDVILPLAESDPVPSFPNPIQVQIVVNWRDLEGRQQTLQTTAFHLR